MDCDEVAWLGAQNPLIWQGVVNEVLDQVRVQLRRLVQVALSARSDVRGWRRCPWRSERGP
eukprot:scaffold8328_cov258-Pinguiococcus_pyrenoidosus.AAC.3